MRNLSNALLRYIHDEICIIRGLVNVVNTREALDFTALLREYPAIRAYDPRAFQIINMIDPLPESFYAT